MKKNWDIFFLRNLVIEFLAAIFVHVTTGVYSEQKVVLKHKEYSCVVQVIAQKDENNLSLSDATILIKGYQISYSITEISR